MFLGELVGDEPGDGFAFEFNLVVVAFDGDEDFADALGVDAKVHPFEGDSAAVCDKFLRTGEIIKDKRLFDLTSMYSRALWNTSKHKDHRQGIIHVSESVIERWIPLQNNVIHIIQGSRVSDLISLLPIPAAFGLLQLFQEDFVRAEFFNERL